MKKLFAFLSVLALATMACATASAVGEDLQSFTQPVVTATAEAVEEQQTLAQSQGADEPVDWASMYDLSAGYGLGDTIPKEVVYPSSAAVKVVPDSYMDFRDPSENVNSLGMNTELFICDAGTYLTDDEDDAEKNASAALISPDTQYLLATAQDWFVAVDEGASSWVTGDALHVEANGYSFYLPSIPGHSWFAIVINQPWDHLVDSDLNLAMKISGHNPSFAQANRFPPGRCLSQTHLQQNVDSAHIQKSSGSDGSTRVGVFILDARTGGYIVLGHTKVYGWYLDGSNIAIAK